MEGILIEFPFINLANFLELRFRVGASVDEIELIRSLKVGKQRGKGRSESETSEDRQFNTAFSSFLQKKEKGP